MGLNLIDFVLLQHVLFYGFLTVSDLLVFEGAFNKSLKRFWDRIMENKNHVGAMFNKPLKYSFYSAKSRANAESIDEWFQNHGAYKMEQLSIHYFNDASCVLGVDILKKQKLVKLSVFHSFQSVPIEVTSLLPYISNCSTTLQELRLFSVGITTGQLCSLSDLVSLKTLCIIHCKSVDFSILFSFLNKCNSLETYHFQTSKEGNSSLAVQERLYKLDSKNCYDKLRDTIMRNLNLGVVRLSYNCQHLCDIRSILKEFRNCERKIAFKNPHNYDLLSYEYEANNSDVSDGETEKEDPLDDDGEYDDEN